MLSGLRQPVAVLHCGDGSQRLFVLEREGTVRILNHDLELIKEPFLDIHKLVQSGLKVGLILRNWIGGMRVWMWFEHRCQQERVKGSYLAEGVWNNLLIYFYIREVIWYRYNPGLYCLHLCKRARDTSSQDKSLESGACSLLAFNYVSAPNKQSFIKCDQS